MENLDHVRQYLSYHSLHSVQLSLRTFVWIHPVIVQCEQNSSIFVRFSEYRTKYHCLVVFNVSGGIDSGFSVFEKLIINLHTRLE